MSAFDLVFALFGLLLGLALCEVLAGFARVLKLKRGARPVRIGGQPASASAAGDAHASVDSSTIVASPTAAPTRQRALRWPPCSAFASMPAPAMRTTVPPADGPQVCQLSLDLAKLYGNYVIPVELVEFFDRGVVSWERSDRGGEDLRRVRGDA